MGDAFDPLLKESYLCTVHFTVLTSGRVWAVGGGRGYRV